MPPLRQAIADAQLRVVIERSHSLLYAAGPDALTDRPAHLRAASGLAAVGDQLVVIQDDANFVALIDPRTLAAAAVLLPAGTDGRRQFDDGRGNKHAKLDLEACLVLPDAPTLVAFGSGSSPQREQIVVVRLDETPPVVTLHPAAPWYAVLRRATDFAGSELNIEGAVLMDNVLTLFQRGNGAARNGLRPITATCEIAWPVLWAFLHDPTLPPPTPTNVVQYDLGALAGLPLSFTDATIAPGGILFAAAAEASPDATKDGPVMGSVLGVITPLAVRWGLVYTADGALYDGKIEGVLLHADQRHVWLVVDRDDPMLPSELCIARLEGFW